MKLKYVITENLQPILFGLGISHDEVTKHKVISAGFCNFYPHSETGDFVVKTFGDSFSLKLKPSPDDAYLIEKLLNR